MKIFNFYFSLFLLCFFLNSCKKNIVNKADYDQGEIIADSSKVSKFRTKLDTAIFNENIEILKLPLGSQIIEQYNFPKKFGLGGVSNLDLKQSKDEPSKMYDTSLKSNFSLAMLNGSKVAYLNYFKKHSSLRKVVFDEDSLVKNMQVIGRVIYNKHVIYFINTQTDPYLSLCNFRSTLLRVVDDEQNVIDELEVFLSISEYLESSNELFYINENFIITKKYFLDLEGEITFLKSQQYELSPKGKFVQLPKP